MPQARAGGFRPGRAPKTMAVKHMAFFQGGGSAGAKRGSGGAGGAGGGNAGGGLGSVTDMWGDGVVSFSQSARFVFCLLPSWV